MSENKYTEEELEELEEMALEQDYDACKKLYDYFTAMGDEEKAEEYKIMLEMLDPSADEEQSEEKKSEETVKAEKEDEEFIDIPAITEEVKRYQKEYGKKMLEQLALAGDIDAYMALASNPFSYNSKYVYANKAIDLLKKRGNKGDISRIKNIYWWLFSSTNKTDVSCKEYLNQLKELDSDNPYLWWCLGVVNKDDNALTQLKNMMGTDGAIIDALDRSCPTTADYEQQIKYAETITQNVEIKVKQLVGEESESSAKVKFFKHVSYDNFVQYVKEANNGQEYGIFNGSYSDNFYNNPSKKESFDEYFEKPLSGRVAILKTMVDRENIDYPKELANSVYGKLLYLYNKKNPEIYAEVKNRISSSQKYLFFLCSFVEGKINNLNEATNEMYETVKNNYEGFNNADKIDYSKTLRNTVYCDEINFLTYYFEGNVEKAFHVIPGEKDENGYLSPVFCWEDRYCKLRDEIIKRENDAKAAKRKRKIAGIILAFAGVLVLAGVLFYRANRTITLDPFAYTDYGVYEADGTGVFVLDVDNEGLLKKIEGRVSDIDDLVEFTYEDAESVQIGDEITVYASLKDAAKEKNIEFSAFSEAITVSSYDEGMAVDIFKDVEISYSGESGSATATIVNNSTDEFVKTIEFSLSKASEIQNGDVLTVTAKVNDAVCDQYKEYPKTKSKTYMASRLDGIIKDFSCLSDEEQDEIIRRGKGAIIAYTGFGGSESLHYASWSFFNLNTIGEPDWTSYEIEYETAYYAEGSYEKEGYEGIENPYTNLGEKCMFVVFKVHATGQYRGLVRVDSYEATRYLAVRFDDLAFKDGKVVYSDVRNGIDNRTLDGVVEDWYLYNSTRELENRLGKIYTMTECTKD